MKIAILSGCALVIGIVRHWCHLMRFRPSGADALFIVVII